MNSSKRLNRLYQIKDLQDELRNTRKLNILAPFIGLIGGVAIGSLFVYLWNLLVMQV